MVKCCFLVNLPFFFIHTFISFVNLLRCCQVILLKFSLFLTFFYIYTYFIVISLILIRVHVRIIRAGLFDYPRTKGALYSSVISRFSKLRTSKAVKLLAVITLSYFRTIFHQRKSPSPENDESLFQFCFDIYNRIPSFRPAVLPFFMYSLL